MKTIPTTAMLLLALIGANASSTEVRHEAAVTQDAAESATRNLLTHHLSSFQDNDLAAVMSDYTSESILITKDATYRGTEQIRTFFSSLIPHFPRHRSTFELDKMVVNDEVVFIVWHANTPTIDVPFATDTFVIKAGKISRQTFAGELKSVGHEREEDLR